MVSRSHADIYLVIQRVSDGAYRAHATEPFPSFDALDIRSINDRFNGEFID